MARSRAMTSPLVSPCRRAAERPVPARRPRVASRLLALVTGLTLVGLVAGCGLRLETPAPTAPSPDSSESARQRASADSVGLMVLAGAPGADPADPVTAIRAAVVTQATEHLDQLGPGDSSTAEPTAEPTADPSSADPSSAVPGTVDPVGTTPAAVVTQLTQAAASARADAASIPDGPLARLLGSVATARLLLARQLAAATAIEGPAVPEVSTPTSAPTGPGLSALSDLVAGEDQAGYGYEVIAAKLSDAARTDASDRAAVHRARADQWATLLEIAGTGLDPRRSAYALPAGLDDPAAAVAQAQTLELSLAATYAALLTATDAESRAVLLDGLTEATATAVAWGAPVPSFPGLPERTAS
ncbi:ferritin-like domain-containing protein [Pengzhenrongella frigida]|uniref:DUF4439 domain-containing protein n=1 Tax=Pengzhenrongella frigida TaxID=1259133 RepID=A0A4Q5N693_9MICO|nr:ferritin-like domain-containing protein [Cellulomonas sp. HLT2-17]RYV52417.1 DUF4439 domain-containing protein [Cellulomonas sp. HLT2-17]